MHLPDTNVSPILEGRSEDSKRPLTYPRRFTLALFMLFAANTVLPLVDIPLLGLSITAALFPLVALEVVFRQRYLDLKTQGRWLIVGYLLGLGILVSEVANNALGNLAVGTDSFVALVQMGYWLIIFLITMALVSHLTLADFQKLVLVIGIAATVLGGIRLYEAVAFARIGASTARIFTQNTYGVLFSAFTPFALVSPFLVRSLRFRFLLFLGVLVLLIAITLNGSRSSWITSAVGLMVLSFLFALVRRRGFFSFAAAVGILLLVGSVLLSILPGDTLAPISTRFATLQEYEDDKSYETRLLTQQKSLALFAQYPLFGVGRNQFRNVEVALDFTGTAFSSNRNDEFNNIASHNSYMQLLAENGLAGTVPLALLLVLLTVNGLRATLKLGRGGHLWVLAIFAGFIAMSVHLWVIDNLKTTGTWFMYGLMAGMIEYQRRQRTPGYN